MIRAFKGVGRRLLASNNSNGKEGGAVCSNSNKKKSKKQASFRNLVGGGEGQQQQHARSSSIATTVSDSSSDSSSDKKEETTIAMLSAGEERQEVPIVEQSQQQQQQPEPEAIVDYGCGVASPEDHSPLDYGYEDVDHGYGDATPESCSNAPEEKEEEQASKGPAGRWSSLEATSSHGGSPLDNASAPPESSLNKTRRRASMGSIDHTSPTSKEAGAKTGGHKAGRRRSSIGDVTTSTPSKDEKAAPKRQTRRRLSIGGPSPDRSASDGKSSASNRQASSSKSKDGGKTKRRASMGSMDHTRPAELTQAQREKQEDLLSQMRALDDMLAGVAPMIKKEGRKQAPPPPPPPADTIDSSSPGAAAAPTPRKMKRRSSMGSITHASDAYAHWPSMQQPQAVPDEQCQENGYYSMPDAAQGQQLQAVPDQQCQSNGYHPMLDTAKKQSAPASSEAIAAEAGPSEDQVTKSSSAAAAPTTTDASATEQRMRSVVLRSRRRASMSATGPVRPMLVKSHTTMSYRGFSSATGSMTTEDLLDEFEKITADS